MDVTFSPRSLSQVLSLCRGIHRALLEKLVVCWITSSTLRAEEHTHTHKQAHHSSSSTLTDPLSDLPSMSLAMVGRWDRVSKEVRNFEGTRFEEPATRSYICSSNRRSAWSYSRNTRSHKNRHGVRSTRCIEEPVTRSHICSSTRRSVWSQSCTAERGATCINRARTHKLTCTHMHTHRHGVEGTSFEEPASSLKH